MDGWPVKEAEARFGEMLERCLADGPQVVTRDGKEAAVLVPADEWARAKGQARPVSGQNRDIKDWLTTDVARHDFPELDRIAFVPRPVDFDD